MNMQAVFEYFIPRNWTASASSMLGTNRIYPHEIDKFTFLGLEFNNLYCCSTTRQFWEISLQQFSELSPQTWMTRQSWEIPLDFFPELSGGHGHYATDLRKTQGEFLGSVGWSPTEPLFDNSGKCSWRSSQFCRP